MKRIDDTSVNNLSKKWKSFDFGPDDISFESSKTRVHEDVKVEDITTMLLKKRSKFNFQSELAPKKISDLAIHPKKIGDVESWLRNVFISNQFNDKKTPFLLMSGPTGSGKTTAINVLCRNMEISVLEWINPVDQDFEFVRGPTQANRFLEFLVTESKYNSLVNITNTKKIILVEDFPNIFSRNTEEFSNVLEACYQKAKYPIIFICTDVNNNKINLTHLLFPQEIQDKYKITHISFNPCATTLMKNALKRAQSIVKDNSDLYKIPSSETIDAIISTTMGDIRCAVNQYYFACSLGGGDLPMETNTINSKGPKRKRKEKESKIKVMAKDEVLGLFHGIGRVLNPKRIETGKNWRLNCDIEKLIGEFSTQVDKVSSFLFENYIRYFGDLKDLCRAVEMLSLAQKFLDKWTDRQDTLEFALWISVLGLMIHNEHRVSKWNQIKGPTKTTKKCSEYKLGTSITVTDFCYVNIIRKTEKFHKFNIKK